MLNRIENGDLQSSTFLPAIALELDLPVDRVLGISQKSDPVVAIAGRELVGDRDLPVYAATANSGSGVHQILLSPVEHVSRPEPLARVRDGYGVLVPDDSMSPKFEANDIALVNPHLTPKAGSYCVFRGGSTEVVIRRIRAVDDEAWHVTEFASHDKGARRDYKLKRADWPTAHVTVGVYDARR
jgi:phage repressor protein C with HTH and peptisase S24 domain